MKKLLFGLGFFLSLLPLQGATPAPHQTIVIDKPVFQNVLHPPEYWGATVAEQIENGGFNVALPAINPADISWPDLNGDGFGDVPSDPSIELDEHPILNRIVADLNRDPVALAAYVLNEIELDRPFLSRSGFPFVSSPSVMRGAGGVAISRQGSPWEQCSLLVYLLRRAGYPAAIVETDLLGTSLMRADRIDRLLGYRLSASAQPDALFQVDYPWVVLNDQPDGNGTWRHVFPWLKDIERIEGFDLRDVLPPDYDSSQEWVSAWLTNDPAVATAAGDPTTSSPVRALESYLQDEIDDLGMAPEDVGLFTRIRKTQIVTWDDFPKPYVIATDPQGSQQPVGLLVKTGDLEPATIPDRFASCLIEVRDQQNNLWFQSDFMALAQLADRPFYISRDFATSTLSVHLEQVEGVPSLPAGDFTVSDVSGPQVFATTDPAFFNPGIPVTVRIYLVNVDGWGNPDLSTFYDAPLPSTGVTAIAFNTGKVGPETLKRRANTLDTLASASPFDERRYAGHLAFFAAQNYWKQQREQGSALKRLLKASEYLDFGIALCSVGPVFTTADPFPVLDVILNQSVLFDGDLSEVLPLQVLNDSVLEHAGFNSVFSVQNSISTARLLQIAERDLATGSGPNPDGFFEFTRSEFLAANAAADAADPVFQPLKAASGSMWTLALSLMGAGDPSYIPAGWERVYITPSDIQMDVAPGETPTFDGMGVLAYSPRGYTAAIDNNLNGAYGPFFGPGYFSSLFANTRIAFDQNGNPYFVDSTNVHPSRDTNVNPVTQSFFDQLSNFLGDTFNNAVDALNAYAEKGGFTPESNQASTQVGDPVDPVTGKFFIDEVDLTLEGPFPLQLRRNYSSLNSAHNLLGHGWKLSLMPYIRLSDDEATLIAADLDGSVLTYKEVASSSPKRWEVSTAAADNPTLSNYDEGRPGGQANRYRAFFERTTEGPDTVYTLHRPDGHTARYVVRSFPIDLGFGPLTRTRPYLDSWEDAFGNRFDFSYYDADPTESFYGQLRRIESTNGNFLGFLYNNEREIREAFTNDGRRVSYAYDAFGDLRSVTLPDNKVCKYAYRHATDSVTGKTFSTHLIERIDEPLGRTLINHYDPAFDPEDPSAANFGLRRVVSQQATVGDDLVPLTNAVYEYFAANDAAVTEPLAQPWTAAGFDVTLIHSDVRPALGRLTHIYVHKDGLIRHIANPLASAAFAPGNTDLDYVRTWDYFDGTEPDSFPRSLARHRDNRGLETLYTYDALGNVATRTERGDITGDEVSEDVVTHTFYNPSNLLPEKIVAPAPDAGGTHTVTVFEYPSLGGAKSAPDPLNPGHELYQYLPVSQQVYQVASPVLTAAPPAPADEQFTTSFLYGSEDEGPGGRSAFGLLQQITHQSASDPADRSRTTYTHDARGYRTSRTEATFTSAPDLVTTFDHTDRGEVRSITDPAQRYTTFEYDPLGRPISTRRFDNPSSLTPLAWEFQYYNEFGELTWTDGRRYAPEDYTFRDYDGAGRLLAEVHWRTEIDPVSLLPRGVPGQDSWLGQAITWFDYDGFGNLESTIDPLGNETTFAYDALGRLTTTTHPQVDGVSAVESHTYEPGGEIETFTNALGGVTTYRYTDHGALRRIEHPAVDGRTEAFTFFLDGRPATHVLSNGAVRSWAYDDVARTVTTETRKDGTLLEKSIETFDTRGNLVRREIFDTPSASSVFTFEYDGLNRIVRETGPPDEMRPGTGETASAQQETTHTYTYNASGERYVVESTTGDETYRVAYDALDREILRSSRRGNGSPDVRFGTVYSPNHHTFQTNAGSDPADNRFSTTVTNTFGQTTLRFFNDGAYTRNVYDAAGNLLEVYDELTLTDGSPRLRHTYDERNRLASTTRLDQSVTTFRYDGANHLVRRDMPGGLIEHRLFDPALRLDQSWLEGTDGTTSRHVDLGYVTGGDFIGLLETRTENAGTPDEITHAYAYDDLLRLASTVSDGANYAGVRTLFSYDLRSRTTGLVRGGTAGSPIPDVRTTIEYDGYSQILSEKIETGDQPTGTLDPAAFVATAVHSHLRQNFDPQSRRSLLGLGADIAPQGSGVPEIRYNYLASGRFASISPGPFANPFSVQYDYADNDLLNSKELVIPGLDGPYAALRTETLNRRLTAAGSHQRDLRGRLLGQTLTHDPGSGPVAVLDETLGWTDDSRRTQTNLTRGSGANTGWDTYADQRAYAYDPDNRRLDTETFAAAPGDPSRTIAYTFDSADLGVRTKAELTGPAHTLTEVPAPDTTGLDPFFRVADETSAPETFTFDAAGALNGPGTFELYLGDGSAPTAWQFIRTLEPESGTDYGPGTWRTPLTLPPGQYTLEARARPLHTGGTTFEATDQTTFTVNPPAARSITHTYDEAGRTLQRTWASGTLTQTFQWDALGNLIGIQQADTGTPQTAGDYTWTATYDPRGRRILTDHQVPGDLADRTIRTWYDPQVEFLPVVIAHQSKRVWIVRGPDLDAGYGRFQGVGGIEALIDEPTGNVTPVIEDTSGHVHGTINLGLHFIASDDKVHWNPHAYSGYGPLPGSAQQPLEFSRSLPRSLGYQGRCIDPTGLYAMGTRHYDPVGGRFLSPDPLGHGATLDLYSYAYGDPINFLDPTGRAYQGVVGKEIVSIRPYNAFGAEIATFSDGTTGIGIFSAQGTQQTFSGVDYFFNDIVGGSAAVASNELNPLGIFLPPPPETDGGRVTQVGFDIAGFFFLWKQAKDQVGKSIRDLRAVDASATKTIPTPTEGQKIYRVYGGDSKAGGASWSPTNPANVPNYRDAAGLPSGGTSGVNNTGQFVIEGTLVDPSKVVKTRPALELDGNRGGLPEYIIPGGLDNGAVRVDRVSGVNPEF